MYTYRVIRVAGLWRVVDRSNGDKVMGFSLTHDGAVKKAKDLEVRLRVAITAMIEQRKAVHARPAHRPTSKYYPAKGCLT